MAKKDRMKQPYRLRRGKGMFMVHSDIINSVYPF